LTAGSVLVAAALLGACGSDEEPAQQAVESARTTTTPNVASTVPPTTPTTSTRTTTQRTTSERQKARKQRRKAKAEARTETTPPATAKQPAPTPPSDEPETSTRPRTRKQPPAPKPRPKPKPPETTGPPTHQITQSANLQLVTRKSSRSYVHEGPVQGTLVGTMTLNTTLGGPGVVATFTVTLPDGSIQGRGSAAVTLAESVVNFKGKATITGGTGAYENANGTGLGFSGTVAADVSTCSIKLNGALRY
jgi:hypothetical protein